MENILDFIGYLSDKHREDVFKKNIGLENYQNLKDTLNKAFEEFSSVIEPKTLEYLKLILKISKRVSVEEICKLPKYSNEHRKIILVDNSNVKDACKDIIASSAIGFDTESEPTFKKGQKNNIVSVIQMATQNTCYIFKMSDISDYRPIGKILKNTQIKKIGVGLNGDSDRLKNDYDFNTASIVNIDEIFKIFGSKDIMGAKQMVAIVLNQNIPKSKTISRSNWATEKLSEKQLVYASDDAFSALDVYYELQGLFREYSNLLPKKICQLLSIKIPK